MIEISKHYNNKIELTFESGPRKHLYTMTGKVEDMIFKNHKIEGVTTPINIIDKPALKFWAVKMGVEFLEFNLPVGKIIDEIEKVELLEGVRVAHMKALTKAAGIGTVLHGWVESYIKGMKPAMPTNAMLKKSARQFLKWVEEEEVEFVASEQKALSLKHEYCGTYDMELLIKGVPCLGDLKTSSGIWETNWLQLGGYKHAIKEEFPKKKLPLFAIIRCGKDGTFEPKVINAQPYFITGFLAALYLNRDVNKIKKFIKTDEYKNA